MSDSWRVQVGRGRLRRRRRHGRDRLVRVGEPEEGFVRVRVRCRVAAAAHARRRGRRAVVQIDAHRAAQNELIQVERQTKVGQTYERVVFELVAVNAVLVDYVDEVF